MSEKLEYKRLLLAILIISIFFIWALINYVTRNEPFIKFVNIEPKEVIAYQDSITITFSYQDKDGDLGENNAAIKNLFVKDSRAEIVYEYRIPQLLFEEKKGAVRGLLSVALPNTAPILNEEADTFFYKLQILDQKRQESNWIQTDAIIVHY